MTELKASDDYTCQSEFTDPGAYAALIGSLPLDSPVLCRILQGF